MIVVREAVRGLMPALLVTLALIIFIDHRTGQVDDAVRRELNTFARAACREAVETDAIGHYNSLIDALIADYEDRKAENEERRDFEKASINSTMLGRLSLAKITEEPPDCGAPIIPER